MVIMTFSLQESKLLIVLRDSASITYYWGLLSVFDHEYANNHYLIITSLYAILITLIITSLYIHNA